MSDSEMSNGFIMLDRGFRELGTRVSTSVDVDSFDAFFSGERLSWNELLTGYRTVILSEAGAGKTEEIRHAATRLRAAGKEAFFLRLEHLAEDIEDAFEVGTFEEYTRWITSSDEGWFLLDSIDEARLRNPGDFERAVRKFGRSIREALTRAHIILTGRTSAWRSNTDLRFCERHLPLAPEMSRIDASHDSDGGGSASNAQYLEVRTTELRKGNPPNFRIVAIEDLSAKQIELFARKRGVTDVRMFLSEIERADAQSFTTRPQDLDDLIAYWAKEHRIGTRLQLMSNSVDRRLEERDENRRQAYPLASKRVREGARLLAAASILSREPTIQVPDGSHNNKGIVVQSLLPDWNERDQQALLWRPVFDEAIYGTVRFYHRSAREFLAAEWLVELLQRSTSRREIEALLFRIQYGVEVVIPTMRPLLPWLAIFDERIRERIWRVAPEVLFEGGDPSVLPLATRKAALAEICEDLASGNAARSFPADAAARAYAGAELEEDIRLLFRTYDTNADVVEFLLRLVRLGRIAGLRVEVKTMALTQGPTLYTRIAAIRALRAIGAEDELKEVRESFLDAPGDLPREVLAEMVNATQASAETVRWLLTALEKVRQKEQFSSDSLSNEIATFAEAAPSATLPTFAEGLNRLLALAPYIDHRICKVSKANSWISAPASTVTARLILARDDAALSNMVMELLHKIGLIRQWESDTVASNVNLGRMVREWPDLNRAFFLYEIRESRRALSGEPNGIRITRFWQGLSHEPFWGFGGDDFGDVIELLESLSSEDDLLVVLSVAFDIYTRGERPVGWLERLREVVKGKAYLEEELENYLAPRSDDHAQSKEKWQREAAERKQQERKNYEDSKSFILSNISLLRGTSDGAPTEISSAQWYLCQRLRGQSHRSNRWAASNWHDLIPEYGKEVALAYREGVVGFWRNYRPFLRSEGASPNLIPPGVIFGLSGLEIEAAETAEWPADLTELDVCLAFRYALSELNGFPSWFPRLFKVFPEAVRGMLISEIKHEVLSSTSGEGARSVLSDICSSGQWAWDAIAPDLLQMLRDTDFIIYSILENLLAVVQGAESISDEDIARLAQERAGAQRSYDSAALWYAAWVGVDPGRAIPALSGHLASIAVAGEQTEFAMKFVTQLIGGRFSGKSGVRHGYLAPSYLKDLYLMMQAYIREAEDVIRPEGKVYSPGLRDDAQDARNALISHLRNIRGKEAFVALSEITEKHPYTKSRSWLATLVKERAEKDADEISPWQPAQVRDFHEHLDRTPTNHRELAELAVMRLIDIKDDLEDVEAQQQSAGSCSGRPGAIDRARALCRFRAHAGLREAAGMPRNPAGEGNAQEAHDGRRTLGSAPAATAEGSSATRAPGVSG